MRKSKKGFIFGVGLILILGCSFIVSQKYIKQPSQTMMHELIQKLEEEGYTVSYEKERKSILAGERYVIYLDEDQFLNIYLYNSEKSAINDARNLSPDASDYTDKRSFMGRSINIDYVGKIHYFLRANMIVCYGGERDELYDCLESFLGTQFAGN